MVHINGTIVCFYTNYQYRDSIKLVENKINDNEWLFEVFTNDHDGSGECLYGSTSDKKEAYTLFTDAIMVENHC